MLYMLNYLIPIQLVRDNFLFNDIDSAFIVFIYFVEPSSFHVEWKLFQFSGVSPCGREMHSTSCIMNTLIIMGGRDENNNMLTDVWALKMQRNGDIGEYSLTWEAWDSMRLPNPRCAHVSCFVSTLESIESISWKLCIFGGFTNAGVSSEVLSIPLDYDVNNQSVIPCSGVSWQNASFSNGPKGRFGHALCPLSHKYLISLWQNSKYRPVVERANLGEKIAVMESIRVAQHSSIDELFHIKLQAGVNCGAAFLFGGVDADQDFADIWLLFL